MTDKLATTPAAGALERPARLKQGDRRGTEHITRDDISMPRLALAQGLTPQVVEQKEGFGVGVLFNTTTGEVYGKGPLEFAIVRADPPRFIEFNPREEGGGVRDMNVPPSDPRTQFGPDGEKPAATKFYDFFIALLPLKPDPMESIICLSMKSTALKVAKQLNTFIKLRNAPLWEGKYSLTTGVDKNDKGVFAIYKIGNALWVDDDTSAVLAAIYESLKDKSIAVEREAEDEAGADDFDPATIEAQM